MAEDSKKVSELELLSSLTGTEFVEVVARTPEGTLKNFRVLSDKFRVGKSAYDAAVENGFTGTEAEWLASMNGKSSYQVAVDNGYEGTEEQWVDSLKPLFELLPENVGMVLTADEVGMPVWRHIDLSFVELDQVDNTSDEDKPVSRAQQQALNRKLDNNKVTSEVMRVLVSLGARISEDGHTVYFDEGRVTPETE